MHNQTQAEGLFLGDPQDTFSGLQANKAPQDLKQFFDDRLRLKYCFKGIGILMIQMP